MLFSIHILSEPPETFDLTFKEGRPASTALYPGGDPEGPQDALYKDETGPET